MQARRVRKRGLLFVVAGCLFASSAQAGGGHINNDGTADLNVNFTYPPTQAEVQGLITEIQIASRILCDASDGAIRLGTINITSGEGQQAAHDIEVIFQPDGRSRSDLGGLGTLGQGKDTGHVNMHSTDLTASTLGHELGHYLFAAGDEYGEAERWNSSCGIGLGIDGTLSEVLDTTAGTVGHTIMIDANYGLCGVVDSNVAGGINYTTGGSYCNFDNRLSRSALGLPASAGFISECPAGQVCFPRQASELTFAANHDKTHGLADTGQCPSGIATTKLEISGTLNGSAAGTTFNGTSFATADATSAFRYDYPVIDGAISKHTATLYFVRRAAAGANKWTVNIGVPRAEVSSCPTAGSGDLCILATIDFTTAPAVPGCGDYTIGTGEQCDTGMPPGTATWAVDECFNKYIANPGEITCNKACGYDTSKCLFPISWSCGGLFPILDWNEECDGALLGGKTCQSLGFGPGGSLSCNPNCTLNTNNCNPKTTYVPPTVTIDGGRTLPIAITFPYTGASTNIQLTRLDPGTGTTFSISTARLTSTYGTDAGAGKTSCAKDQSLQYCIDGYNNSTAKFETSDHSHRYRKDCTGNWVSETKCDPAAADPCPGWPTGTTCATINAPCEEPAGTVATSCNRCRTPSPLPTPAPCSECSTNPNAMCGVPEKEVLLRVLKDLNSVPGRALQFASTPPTAPDPISTVGGWDEPKSQCFSQVNVTNSVSFPDMVYIIIDMSGSMSEPIYPGSIETKLNYAKAAVRNYVNKRSSDTLPLGLSYFDHEVNPAVSTAPAMVQVPIAAANAGTPTTTAQKIVASNDAMVTRNGSTAIGNALIAAVSAFQAAGNASSRRILILTDGMNNTGPAPDDPTVKAALATLNIHVDITPIGTNVDQAKLDILAGLSAGQVHYAPQGDYVPDTFSDFGVREKSDSIALPETESLVYNASAFSAQNCTRDSCISPTIHAPLSASENYPITVEQGAQQLEVLLVSRQNFSGAWAPDFQLISPNGSQVITAADTAFVTRDDGHATCIEIPNCSYWTRITVPAPAAGNWQLQMATTQAFQASFVSARVRHPEVQCFVDVDKSTVPDGKGQRIYVSAHSGHEPIDARTMNITGKVTGPNGVSVPLTFTTDKYNTGFTSASFKGFVGRGAYDVSVRCDVPKTAKLAAPEPQHQGVVSTPVMPFVRWASKRFFYNSTTMPPGVTADDCDFDTIPDSIEGSVDTDADGWPDKCDSDADNDGLSDAVEGTNDTDGDGKPDYKDADSDNDTIGDERDNCKKQANTDQSDIDSDNFGDVCDIDMDGDGRINTLDNCPNVANPTQADSNGNGIGDACEGTSGCTPVITANAQAVTRCVDAVAPTALTASATCNGLAIPLFGSVQSVNGVAISNGTTFAASAKPDLPLGSVVIKWTATGPGKITVTKTQTVTITQADTAAACCPAGYTQVTGTAFNETLLYPLAFSYCVMSKGGNDTITGGLGPDVFSGGDGNDNLLGISGYDTLIGGNGDDQATLSFAGIAYGGPGNDTLNGVFGPATLYGGDGNDTINGSPFNDDITPGAGADNVHAGFGNDIVRINAPCEAGLFEVLDGGLGFDILYTPVPLSQLQLLGVVVVGFEKIVVTGTADAYKSACALVPCTPAPCGPLPACGSQLWSSCPGQLINCPCNAPMTCRDGFNNPTVPGQIGTCK